jgi:hypothetical protein
MSRERIIGRTTVERAMSDTSQSVGRIAVLTACTLLFAAAWQGDAHTRSRPATIVAWTKRGSGSAIDSDCRGAIADGLIATRPTATLVTLPARINGQLLSSIPPRETPRAPLFSGTPALLGRSTLPVTDDALTTAAAIPEQTR